MRLVESDSMGFAINLALDQGTVSKYSCNDVLQPADAPHIVIAQQCHHVTINADYLRRFLFSHSDCFWSCIAENKCDFVHSGTAYEQSLLRDKLFEYRSTLQLFL